MRKVMHQAMDDSMLEEVSGGIQLMGKERGVSDLMKMGRADTYIKAVNKGVTNALQDLAVAVTELSEQQK